ncbi:MAG: methyltransferase family protein [Dehalococcoidia bacterium]
MPPSRSRNSTRKPAPPGTGAELRPVPQAERPAAGRRLKLDLPAILLGLLILWFAGVNIRLWIQHPGRPVGLGAVVLQLVQGTLFFLRRRDRETGRRAPSVWLATMIGSWGFLAERPAGSGFFDAPLLFTTGPLFGVHPPWIVLGFAGTLMAILSLGFLGRSFGLLAGNRGVRTNGAYRLVRHPAYASYFVTDLGYVLENVSLWNVVIFGCVIVAQLCRIHQEEATLLKDPAYRLYRDQVRYRLLPGIY